MANVRSTVKRVIVEGLVRMPFGLQTIVARIVRLIWPGFRRS